MKSGCALACLMATWHCSASAFSVVTRLSSPCPTVVSGRTRWETLLHLSGDDEGETTPPPTSSKRQSRVRRKTEESGVRTAPAEAVKPQKVMELKPRKESAVSLEVKDVRDLVGTRSPTSIPSTKKTTASSPRKTLASFPEVDTSGDSLDNSLEQLLADAREMKGLEEDEEEEKEDGAMSMIKNAISTLVTADFFVVCLFFVWFIAGVFCSYILKDDTVQIAFNSNFQQFVQPALGVLMIASVADGVINRDKDEDGQ
jgi:hypothetical protein